MQDSKTIENYDQFMHDLCFAPPTPNNSETILRDCMGFDIFCSDKFTENNIKNWPFIYIRFISYS